MLWIHNCCSLYHTYHDKLSFAMDLMISLAYMYSITKVHVMSIFHAVGYNVHEILM